jgi:hypothetical protein
MHVCRPSNYDIAKMQRYHHLLPHLQTLLEEARFLEKRIQE